MIGAENITFIQLKERNKESLLYAVCNNRVLYKLYYCKGTGRRDVGVFQMVHSTDVYAISQVRCNGVQLYIQNI